MLTLFTVSIPIILKLIDKLWPEKISKKQEWTWGKKHKIRMMEKIERHGRRA